MDHVPLDNSPGGKVLFSFRSRSIWNLREVEDCVGVTLVSGGGKTQTQVSLVTKSSGARGLAKIGDRLDGSGMLGRVEGGRRDHVGLHQEAEGCGRIRCSLPLVSWPQVQARGLSYQLRQSEKELL